jgi:hypothetical protein
MGALFLVAKSSLVLTAGETGSVVCTVGKPNGDNPVGVDVGESEGLLNRAAPKAGDFLDGRVLLLWTPMVGVDAACGVA